jgi:hypothetical protein
MSLHHRYDCEHRAFALYYLITPQASPEDDAHLLAVESDLAAAWGWTEFHAANSAGEYWDKVARPRQLAILAARGLLSRSG